METKNERQKLKEAWLKNKVDVAIERYIILCLPNCYSNHLIRGKVLTISFVKVDLRKL